MNKVIEEQFDKLADKYAGIGADLNKLYQATLKTVKTLRRSGYITSFSVEKIPEQFAVVTELSTGSKFKMRAMPEKTIHKLPGYETWRR